MVDVGGRIIAKQKSSMRPPWIWPEAWRALGLARRDALARDWDAIQYRIKLRKAAEALPAMPVHAHTHDAHRPHIPMFEFPFNALVARPVSKAEIRNNPKADAALMKEWDALRKANCWDESKVREWSDVAREARDKDQKAHVGRIFEICVEKGSELSPDDPARKL